MTASDASRLQSIFAQAAELAPAERDAFLAAECADDLALLAQLRSLLAADDELAHATARKAFPSLSGLMTDAAQASSLQGLRVGPYELREELGRGGMGTVYRAERVDGTVAQQVAIKFVRRELLDLDAFERFRRERQLLASLDHPNIARLIDAAEAPDGTPYYVMELVAGQSIDVHCAERALDVRARLRLMRKVCDAVVHAHRNLVVHRDLKPGNILVTAAGEPKLLDFGIAKPLGDEHFVTGTAQRFFSPYYAAPEQVLGKPIGVGCDVYALGLLLYELVSGARPFAFEGLTAGQIERLICEVPPPPPSRARAPGETTIRHKIDAELDDLVLKCLRKAPAERYASVEQLDADLANYLEGRPVAARGGHALYRTRKFVGRHRLAFGISLAALVALGIAVSAIVQRNVELARERDRVIAERDRAEQLATFLQDAFTAADPSRTAGAEVTARQILGAAHEKVADGKRGAAFPADFAKTIAEVELSLGMVDEARGMAELAVAQTPARDASTARLHVLAARAQVGAGDFAAADASIKEAARFLPASDPELQLVRATLATERGDYATSLATISSAAAAIAAEPPTSDLATSIRWRVADTLRAMRRQEDSLASIDETIRWQLTALPANHPDVTKSRLRRVQGLQLLGRPEEALETARAAYEQVREVYGADSLMAATTGNALGYTLWHAGRREESIPHFETALRILREGLGDAHPRTLPVMFNVAGIYVEYPQRFDEGERLYRLCISGATERLGTNHDGTLTMRQGFAGVLIEKGRPDEALDVLTEHAPDLDRMQNPRLARRYRETLALAYSAGACKGGGTNTLRAACTTGRRMMESAAASGT